METIYFIAEAAGIVLGTCFGIFALVVTISISMVVGSKIIDYFE